MNHPNPHFLFRQLFLNPPLPQPKKLFNPKKIPRTSSPKGKRKTPSSSSSLIYIDEESKTKRPKPTSSKTESGPTTLSATVNKQLAPTFAKGSMESEEDLLCHESLPAELQSSSSKDSKHEGVGELDKDSLRAKVWAVNEELIKVKHKFATLMEFYKAAGVETEGYVAEIKELKEKNAKLEENQSTYNELQLLNRIQAITIKDLEAKLKSSGENVEAPSRPRSELQLDEIQTLQLALKQAQEETRKAKAETSRAQTQMKEMRDKFLSEVQEISTKTSKQMLLAEEDFDKWKSEMLDSVRDLQTQLDMAKNPPAKGSS
jgi:hypothetical protein